MRIQDVYAAMNTRAGDTLKTAIPEDGLDSDFFAGYLVGFSKVLVRELTKDAATHVRYSDLFLDSISMNCTDWTLDRARTYVWSDKNERSVKGFHAGMEDAFDCVATNRPTLLRLGQFFIYGQGVAA